MRSGRCTQDRRRAPDRAIEWPLRVLRLARRRRGGSLAATLCGCAKADEPAAVVTALRRSLDRRSPTYRRAAAEAARAHRRPEAIRASSSALADETNDRALDHALTYALIEIGDAKETAEGLEDPSRRACGARASRRWRTSRTAASTRRTFSRNSTRTDAALRETAWWIAGRHPQWGDQLAGYFQEKLKTADKLKPEERDELADRLGEVRRRATRCRKLLGEAACDKPEQRLDRSCSARWPGPG